MHKIDQQTKQQEERRQQEQFALHGNQVAVADIVDQHRPQSGQVEQTLNNHHARDHLGESQSRH